MRNTIQGPSTETNCMQPCESERLEVEVVAEYAQKTRQDLYTLVKELEDIQGRHTGHNPIPPEPTVAPERSGSVGSIRDSLDGMDAMLGHMRRILHQF